MEPVDVDIAPDHVRAVLLDMDGTLVDSDGAVARAWEVWATEFDVPADGLVERASGRPAGDTAAEMLPGADAEHVAAPARRQLELQYSDLDGVVAARGAGQLLQLLERTATPWAVVTSADRRLAGTRLGAAGIRPPVLVTSEDIPRGKPDPAGYLLAARLVGVEPAHCLVVEDAPAGVAAGRAAGCRTVGLRGLPADVTVNDLAELAHRLEGVLST